MRVIVIGAGVIGCATAYELRKHGFEVTVIEKNGAMGHGSTSASCGIIRRFYSQPGMIALAHEGAAIWADWANHIGKIDDDLAKFHRPGMIFIPPAVNESVKKIVSDMETVGVPVELLSPDDIKSRFPFFDVSAQSPVRSPDDEDFYESTGRTIDGAVYEPDAGYVVYPSLAASNLGMAAKREGVGFMLNCRVTAIEHGDAPRFRLQTSKGDVEGDVVINIAGPHSSMVNQMAGATLPLQTRALRREIHHLPNPFFEESTGVNPVPIIGDLDGGIYARPESGGRAIVVGSTDPECDELEWIDDPDDYHEGITEVGRQRQCQRLMKRIPELMLGPRRGVGNLYDVTVEDWYPIADKTDLPGYYVCIGTSGSSFKTAPILGRLMTETVEACENGRDIDKAPLQFKLDRIGRTVDASFLSRRRAIAATTSTVIG